VARERLAVSRSLQFNPLVVPALLESLNSGFGQRPIKAWLEQLLEAYHFTGASLWDKTTPAGLVAGRRPGP